VHRYQCSYIPRQTGVIEFENKEGINVVESFSQGGTSIIAIPPKSQDLERNGKENNKAAQYE